MRWRVGHPQDEWRVDGEVPPLWQAELQAQKAVLTVHQMIAHYWRAQAQRGMRLGGCVEERINEGASKRFSEVVTVTHIERGLECTVIQLLRPRDGVTLDRLPNDPGLGDAGRIMIITVDATIPAEDEG
jgi:hypothetical protein